jgi:ubiquinone/menaquinone biosynthesis C-methylase UbiE
METLMPGTTDDARFWDGVARKYATDRIKDMVGYERTLARTRDVLGQSDSVHEIGCGTGTTALRLAGSVARIMGSDVSTEMIAIARERAISEGCENASFEVNAADKPPAANSAFDAVLAFNLLHVISDRAATLACIRRQLKPKGLFISKTPCLSEMNPMLRFAVPVARMVGKAPFVAFFDAPALAAQIAAAGFKLEAQERHGSGRKDARMFIVARKTDE